MAPAAWLDEGQAWTVDAIHDKVDAGSRAAGSQDWATWGTVSTAPAVTQTGLLGETTEARVQGTVTQPAANQYRLVATQTATADHLAGGTGSIKEAGVFNQSTVSGDVAFIRGTFSELNIEQDDQVTFTFTLSLADSSE